ncbi:MAG TPA: hypothetical protein VE135_01985 [Pyrinomonadaceae bacterium]|nr:hypothetical protein [Pyrinomonadaceae bacterium]
MFEWLGWLGTALSAGSYLFKRPVTLRRVQALAALAWIAYGALVHSLPLIVANLIVGVVAMYSSFRSEFVPVESKTLSEEEGTPGA